MIKPIALAGLAVAVLLARDAAGAASERGAAVERAASLVAQMRRADYEGDRATLARVGAELAPLAEHPGIGTRVEYWRGFALWRRAINGVNDGAESDDMRHDLEQAVAAFERALARDSGFVDAQVATGSCLMFLLFLDGKDTSHVATYVPRAMRRLNQAKALDPDHPRLLWVQGAREWYRAAGGDSGQRRAFATYERGLRSARSRHDAPAGSIEPGWGEPELLMSMAWSHLNARVPDLDAAERRAREALALVPHWHYVRDILIPQIAKAREHSRSTPDSSTSG